MKKFVSIILLLILPTFLMAQVPQDSVKFSMTEVNNMVKNIKQLQAKVKLQEEEIETLDMIVSKLKYIQVQDSLIITAKDKQIELINENLKLTEQKYKTSFWDSEAWGFIQGAGLILISSWVVSNIK